MRPDWGRFTLLGGPQVEDLLTDMASEVANSFATHLEPRQYRALLLIGGYGRGEGGTEVRGGAEHPHNNLDFLLVARQAGGSELADLKTRLDGILQPIARRRGIGMDLGIVTDQKLLHSPCLVMWHDMRFGHKTLLGDAEFVPSLRHFTPEAIVAADVRNLLVNRGTLLLVNEVLLERGTLSENERRTVVKHAMKAIIGYGDALLFCEGAYHWSYAEKQRRMRTCRAARREFRHAYDEAARFRFRPNYDAFLDRDLGAWMQDLRRMLEPVHLVCEARRLGMRKPAWSGYLDRALAQSLLDGLSSPRQVAKKVLNLARFWPARAGLGLIPHLGSRASGVQGLLPLIFPVALYELGDGGYRTWAAAVLDGPDASRRAVRDAYLQEWGRHGDVNFSLFLERLGLTLPQAKGVAA